MILYIFFILIFLIIGSVAIFFYTAPQLGAKSSGVRLTRILQSPNFKNGKFQNSVKTPMSTSENSIMKGMWKYFTGGENREPKKPLPTIPFDKNQFNKLENDSPVICWFGHSTVLIKLEDTIFITDPVFCERASMFPSFGPKRFEYENSYSIEDLPRIDAVIISHDHYDHLDYQAIKKLHPTVEKFFVPLGVAAHLEKWGVPVEKIVELDWWEEGQFDGFTLIATPARHFSGRGITDRFKTLWCSWVIKSEKSNIYFGGDSGFFPGFREIEEKFGPIDFTMMECGAYSQYWSTIHMKPEETARAHLELKGKVLMPIHWGKFNLSLHSWTEPVERLSAKKEMENIRLATPVIGEIYDLEKYVPTGKWWEKAK
ncbi:MAG: MBL fold metallo-hydrolase [Candidatus Aminicenantes bacterium]|nr:MBL fold metallo-hydrolase [Candidatus Aminicenantes bacterium]